MSEQESLLSEIDDPRTNHRRRLEIGDRLSEIGDTRPGVGLREDGTPDIAWLPVTPGGQITIEQYPVVPHGKDILEKETFIVPPFYIAKYLITNAQYEAFVKAADGYKNPEWWRRVPKDNQRQTLREQNTKSKNNPRDTISWYQSIAFARWLNHQMNGLELPNLEGMPFIIGQNTQVRLPLEWEWQWAAQNGTQQRLYPRGDWQKGYANTIEAGLNRTVAVGMYPQGAAACGALDMAGQLWEWCTNDYSPIKTVAVGNGNRKVWRGGAFDYLLDSASCVCRSDYYSHLDNYYVGVRVVISTPIEGF